MIFCNRETIKAKLDEGSYGEIKVVGDGNITVGKYCSLAKEIVAIFLLDHRVDWISTYPFPVLWNLPIAGHPVMPDEIKVGNDVWIGAGTTLLGGAEIGDGAVIGAFSLVAGKIPPYSIAVGHPAKVIRKRFSEDIINDLLKIAWWNWDKEKIMENVKLLCSQNVKDFIKKNKVD